MTWSAPGLPRDSRGRWRQAAFRIESAWPGNQGWNTGEFLPLFWPYLAFLPIFGFLFGRLCCDGKSGWFPGWCQLLCISHSAFEQLQMILNWSWHRFLEFASRGHAWFFEFFQRKVWKIVCSLSRGHTLIGHSLNRKIFLSFEFSIQFLEIGPIPPDSKIRFFGISAFYCPSMPRYQSSWPFLASCREWASMEVSHGSQARERPGPSLSGSAGLSCALRIWLRKWFLI